MFRCSFCVFLILLQLYISREICFWKKFYFWHFQKEFGHILSKCSKQASSCSRDNFKRNTNEITLSTEAHCNALQGAWYSSDHIRTNIICELCFIIGFRIACCGNSINPNWHEGGHFPPPCPFWNRFCQLNFHQKFPNFNIIYKNASRWP